MKNSIWKDEEKFKQACVNANTRKEILNKLGVSSSSTSYRYLKYWASLYKVELPDGCLYNYENRKNFTKISLDDILVKNSNFNRVGLKNKLLKAKLLENKCNACGLGPKWNDKVLNLQLEHINGDSLDNRLENLTLLCPNCHSQTDTFCRRKTKKKVIVYCDCGNIKTKEAKKCRYCASLQRRKINWPSLEELDNMLEIHSLSQIAKKLGVSDVAVKKHIKNAC